MLYPALKGWLPRGYAVVLTGLLFGLIHGSLSAFLPLAAFGCVLCLFRDRYGLVTCMALHMLFNLPDVHLAVRGAQRRDAVLDAPRGVDQDAV